MEVTCRCGYEGERVIQYEVVTPYKILIELSYGYSRNIEWIQESKKTLIWACPKCNRILVRQIGGMSYDQHELAGMRRRLIQNSYANRRWLRELEKTKAQMRELNALVKRTTIRRGEYVKD